MELAAKDKLDLPTLPKWGEGEMMYFSRDAPSSAIDGVCVFVCVRVSFFFGVCCKKNRLSKAKSKALAAFQHASR